MEHDLSNHSNMDPRQAQSSSWFYEIQWWGIQPRGSRIKKEIQWFLGTAAFYCSQSKEQHVQHLKPQENLLAKIYIISRFLTFYKKMWCFAVQKLTALCLSGWLLGYCHVVFKGKLNIIFWRIFQFWCPWLSLYGQKPQRHFQKDLLLICIF